MPLLGWCITGHHEDCFKTISTNVCDCKCHIEGEPNEDSKDI